MSGGRPPTYISKGMVSRKVDEICNGPLRSALLAVLNNPGKGGADWIQFLVDHGLNPRRGDYLRNVWFNQSGAGLWQAHQPIEPIVRQGLIEAIELASRDPDTQQERNLPIDSYWMCLGDQVEVVVTYSAHQVTRIILTPPIPESPPDPSLLLDMEPILIVKRTQPAEVEHHRDPAGQWVTVRLKASRRP